jgi:hypothetical protein
MNKQELYIFLRSLPEKAFDNWLENASEEELELAEEMFSEFRQCAKDIVEKMDTTEAKNLLKKFTLKG